MTSAFEGASGLTRKRCARRDGPVAMRSASHLDVAGCSFILIGFLGAASDAVHRYTVAVFAAHLSEVKSNDAREHSQARINSPADDSEACYDFRSESATLHRSMREQRRHRARGGDVEAGDEREHFVQARREFRPRQLHLSLRAFPLVLAMMATLSALGFSDDPGCARARFQESDVSALRRHVSDVIAFTIAALR
jgi:hypothetical protein